MSTSFIGKFRVDLTGYLAMALPLEAIARNMGFLQPLAVCQTPYPIMMADAAVAVSVLKYFSYSSNSTLCQTVV